MSEKKYTPCGGCGATAPIQRCLGCAHPFRPIETPMTGRWINLSENYTEDWEIMHCRFADDKYKLDTDLFDEKDGCLIKKGGTGAVRLSEVEYLVESESPAEQPVREVDKEVLEFIRDVAENWDCDPDSHTYNLRCRKCEATKLYNLFKQPPAEWSGEKEGGYE